MSWGYEGLSLERLRIEKLSWRVALCLVKSQSVQTIFFIWTPITRLPFIEAKDNKHRISHGLQQANQVVPVTNGEMGICRVKVSSDVYNLKDLYIRVARGKVWNEVEKALEEYESEDN